MTALALELSIRAAATRTGGGAPVSLTSDGVLLKAATNTLEIRDTVTPANNYNGVPSGKIVTTRASTAYYYDSSGVLQTSAIGTHRLDYDPRLGGAAGFLTEETKVSVVRWSQDLTNVVWTPTNLTAVKDQTGPDGVANSATKLTATGVNGLILQTTTVASSARWQSAFVKRITGSGAVAMTMDNVTWTDITVTGAWTRVEIPAQTLANPTVGIRLAVSGDAIAVWNVQNENGLFASSPILTTSAVSTTRASDSPRLAGALFPLNVAEGTLYAKAMIIGNMSGGTQVAISVDDTGGTAKMTNLVRNGITQRLELNMFDTSSQAAILGVNTLPPLTMFKISGRYRLNDTQAAMSNETARTPDTVCTMPAVNSLNFGSRTVANTTTLSGWVFEAMYLPTGLTNTQLMDLVA